MARINTPRSKSNPNRNFSEKVLSSMTYIITRIFTVLPREVEIRSRLTKRHSLNIPPSLRYGYGHGRYVLAMALAREGRIGILHKNMSIERQVEQVRKVSEARAA